MPIALREVTRKIQEIVSAKAWKHRDENGEDADLSEVENIAVKFEIWNENNQEYVEYQMDEETKKFVEEGLEAPDDDTNRNIHLCRLHHTNKEREGHNSQLKRSRLNSWESLVSLETLLKLKLKIQDTGKSR